MNDLEAIARDLHLSAESLKLPVELLKQGYDPSFLATYRPDELGQMDAATLARLQRGVQQRTRLSSYKEKLCIQGETEGWWQPSLNAVVDAAQTIAEVDGLTRNIRSRKSSRILAQKDPRLAQLGQAILTMSDKAPSDLVAWVGEQTNTATEEAKQLLVETKQWLQVLLSEDAPFLHRLGRLILRRGQLSIKLLAEQAERETKPKTHSDQVDDPNASSDRNLFPENRPDEHASEDESLSVSYATIAVGNEDENVAQEIVAADGAIVESVSQEISIVEPAQPIDPLLAAFPNTPASKTRSSKLEKKAAPKAPAKQLSPRQRRRKWLRSILQRYSKLRIPLQRIGHYQALMLGRGQRSQIVSIKMDYDRQPLTQMARDALCPGPHPLNNLLMEVSEEALNKIILPRLEHDVFSEMEETAHHELTEMAVRHLQDMLQQRPVRGHRILVIDAMGPKTAAVAIVDPNGHVDFTGELSAVSSRADVVAQNVTTLGQWIHQYRVTLVAVSNGNTRRYLIHTVNELMKQSGEGGLHWTIVDRTGADAYCETRQALQELPKIAKRYRAAVWLAWRLQDPLIELTKVDPARLRLGSYQRELPQETLEAALLQSVSASVAARGIDVWHSHEKALVCLPGVTTTLSRAIIALRDSYQLSTREKMTEALREHASEIQLRQAIGYLRLFGSTQPLDGTMIHPDDYRLAERLVAAGPLTAPPLSPEGWQKPTKEAKETTSGADAPSPDATESQSFEEASANAESDLLKSNSVDEALSEVESILDATVAPSTSAMEETASPVALVSDSETPESLEVANDAAKGSEEIVGFSPVEGSSENTTTHVLNVPDPALKLAKPMLVLSATNPQNPTDPELAPPLTIDVERLARSWQVGREKMRVVARSLQQPFADSRDSRLPIPLLSQVPTHDTLRPGMAAWGIVIGVADFGAFIDLGPDCNGLIHVSRLSREFVEDPHEVVQIGDLLQVWVLHVDHEKKRIALSALPPGTEVARRPSSHDEAREPSAPSNSNRGFSGNRSPSARPGQSQDNRSSSGQGQRGQEQRGQGQRGQGQGNGQGQNSQGQAQRGRGSSQQGSGQQGSSQRGSNQRTGRDRYERREDTAGSSESNSQRSRTKPSQPAPPITDAMQEGKEPLRSFSDLMQFFQTKREEPTKTLPPPSTASETSVESVESVVEDTEAKPNS